MQCSAESGDFLNSKLKFLNYNCDDIGLYLTIVLFLYPLFWIGRQELNTQVNQMHREQLSLEPKDRNIACLVLFNVLQSLAHILVILLVSTNNVGIILSSLVGHAIAIAYVYRTRRTDIKHPIIQLANALELANAELTNAELTNEKVIEKKIEIKKKIEIIKKFLNEQGNNSQGNNSQENNSQENKLLLY